VRRKNVPEVPKDHGELYDTIKENRKSKMQLLKMGLKLKKGKKWR